MKTFIEVSKKLNWLGNVVELDTFGPYQVATYKEKDFDTKKITEKLAYVGYVNGETLNNQSFCSFDSCIADLIACANGDTNGHASKYFMKMIK